MNKTQILDRGIAKFNLLSLMLLLAALLFSVSNTYSQQDNSEKKQRKTPEERAQNRADKMKEKLSLTDDQHKQVYDILITQGNEMKSVWESSKNDQDKTARKEKMKAIRESGNTQINSVLNANQQQLWETHKKEKKEKHKGKKHKGKKNKGSKKELK
jgi:protein CpxP